MFKFKAKTLLLIHPYQLLQWDHVECQAETPPGEDQLEWDAVTEFPGTREECSEPFDLLGAVEDFEQLLHLVGSVELRLQEISEVQKRIAEKNEKNFEVERQIMAQFAHSSSEGSNVFISKFLKFSLK